jgi:hypothetical protein
VSRRLPPFINKRLRDAVDADHATLTAIRLSSIHCGRTRKQINISTMPSIQSCGVSFIAGSFRVADHHQERHHRSTQPTLASGARFGLS